MADFPLRDIIHEPDSEEMLAALIPDLERADEFIAAAEEVLAHEPRDGVPATKDGSVWYLPMSLLGGKSVALYYTFDDHSVTLLAIVTE